MADADSILQQILDLLEDVSEPDSKGWRSALCIFHEDHDPSMRVKETGFKCFACGEKGGIRKLAEKLGIQVPRGKGRDRGTGSGIALEELATAKGLDRDLQIHGNGTCRRTETGQQRHGAPFV